MMKNKLTFIGLTISLIVGCESVKLNSDVSAAFEVNKTQNSGGTAVVPDSVIDELMPAIDELADPIIASSEKRFDIDAVNLPITTFFQSLVVQTPLSVAIHPDVSGDISLSLKGVTLADVVDIVRDMYGYEIEKQGRILKVFPSGLRTETFSVDYLSMQRMGISMTSITSGGVSDSDGQGGSGGSGGGSQSSNSRGSSSSLGNSGGQANGLGGMSGGNKGTTIVTQNQNDFWQELKTSLENLVGKGDGKAIIVNAQAGLVTIRALPDELRNIRQFLAKTETHLQRQVILEAKLVEVSLEDEFQQGINWQSILRHSGNMNFDFSTSGGNFANSITSAVGGIANLSFVHQDFSGVLSLLETQGNVQVLSSPRLTASNNQKAVIKVGTDEYYVTNVTTTTVTGTTTTSSPSIELEPFFSGIALDVTPQIDEHGMVTLHVHPSVIETQEQTKTITLNEQGFELPLAQSTVRESDTVIRAKSGEIVIIGGLMQSKTRDVESKVPLLGDVPWLGEAFTSRSEVVQKKELVIMIKPIVVEANTWTEQLQRSSDLLQSWYGEE